MLAVGPNSVIDASGEAGQVARRLDHRHLHAEADAEERHLALARELHRLRSCLRCRARRSRPAPGCRARPRDGCTASSRSNISAVDPVQLHLHIVGDPAMGQRLGQRFVAVDQVVYLPTTAMRTSPSGSRTPLHDPLPARQVGRRRRRQAEMPQHLAVQALGVIGDRHLVDGVHVQGRDHRLGPHVAEQRDLAPVVLRDLAVAAAEQHVRLDADALQLLDRMLGRLGLELARRRDVGHQGQMDEHGPLAARDRCRAGGSPRGTAGSRCRRPCRRSRPAGNRHPRYRRGRIP